MTVDDDMADAGLRWLELAASGADDSQLRDFFFHEVAPTEESRAIIRHWARFRDWDEEMFYDFILEALDRKPTDAPLVNGDGQPTRLGHARHIWTAAVADGDHLREGLEALRSTDVRQAALAKARRVLPAQPDVSNRFHVVVFGASGRISGQQRFTFERFAQCPLQVRGENGVRIDTGGNRRVEMLLRLHDLPLSQQCSCEIVMGQAVPGFERETASEPFDALLLLACAQK